MDRIRVNMTPHPNDVRGKEHSGIAQVVLNWARYLPNHGIDVVEPGEPFDLSIGHVTSNVHAEIHVSHGLLWTEEMKLGKYAFEVNADLVIAAKHARRIIVPSEWVADVYRRDMRLSVDVIGHGINPSEWEHNYPCGDYVLYTKNRTSDGLDAGQINDVARAMPNTNFYTTFATRDSPPNVITYGGTVPFSEMKRHIQEAGVVFMPDRETWGIVAAEALAAHVPVCSTNAGAVKDFVDHGLTGYIYQDRNLADAIQGIKYCLKNGKTLGENGGHIARTMLDWRDSVARVSAVIREVYDEVQHRKALYYAERLNTVSVVITSHNYGDVVGRAIQSALEQSHPVDKIIVVDDSSIDNTRDVVREYCENHDVVEYLWGEYGNVAQARNAGIQIANSRFVVILDADDYIRPDYVRDCLELIVDDKEVGFSYSGSEVFIEDTGETTMPPELAEETGKRAHRPWPTTDFDKQFMQGYANQFPACAMFRKSALEKVGGYLDRYAPEGAGTEDADLYLRLLATGFKGAMATPTINNLWVHSHGRGHVSGADDYKEVNWRAWHPYTKDYRFPFAAVATPKNISHPVRSYEPDVSVIIPVGPNHQTSLATALSSIESQMNRKWEAVVIWDFGPSKNVMDYYSKAFPFVRWGMVERRGPGAARNLGVEMARADYVTFLDADDYYGPDFLTHVNPAKCKKSGGIVYSQYYSRMTKAMLDNLGGNVVKDEGNTVIVDYSFHPYDLNRAMARPDGDRPYVWSGVNIMLHKHWHEFIGGFDESLRTWEDCLYLLRLAWYGYPFTRIDMPLWVYNFTEGERRNKSAGHEAELMIYFQEAYDRMRGGQVEYAV